MNTIRETDQFAAWFDSLRDQKAIARIVHRIRSATEGNFGDVQSVGDGVFEMRVHYGPGYRMYYARTDATVYLLLVGGDKSSQHRDIATAHALWRNIKGK